MPSDPDHERDLHEDEEFADGIAYWWLWIAGGTVVFILAKVF